MRLADVMGHWLGKVEVVLAGADADLREGEQALAGGDAMRARASAKRVLERAPDSPLGLALLADACELGGLDAELALTLEELVERVPSRAEVWVRLGRARQRTGATPEEVREAFVRGLAVAEPGSDARRDALLALADLDLDQGDGTRAELWLERAAADRRPDVAVRRAEARLLLGDAEGARAWLEGVELDVTDGRAALARGRALALLGDPGAFTPLLRAMVLDVPGAADVLSSALASIPSDETTRARIRSVVEARGEGSRARWRAAFARAAGERDVARAALREAVAAGDTSAVDPLLEAALDDRDHDALADALAALPGHAPTGPLIADARRIPSRAALEGALAFGKALLDEVAAVTSPRVVPWVEAIVQQIAEAWIPSSGAPAAWDRLLERLDRHARAFGDLDAVARVVAIAGERRRPVRVAIVGEFNAGKSTFINALMGADVAPTGVLPTTATLHHLRYAPDPIARIQRVSTSEDAPDRIVPVGELRATLKGIDASTIRRVEILLPIASLTRVEILDTPGFNAPDARHAEAARAAFEEADAAIWLLDAGQALKQSERVILEEARAARIPVQMLVNKADRLPPDDLAKVMDLVTRSLAEVGLVSWSPPLALSARKALAGRLGDARALEESGWDAVQALLDEQIVGRSHELKERALRRRALLVVERLAARAAQLADAEAAELKEEAERAHAIAQAAAALDRNARDASEHLARSLQGAAAAWQRDLDVVVTGRDPARVVEDRAWLRYRTERALARLAPPLAHALTAVAPGARLTYERVLPMARTLVRTAATCSDPRAFESVLPTLASAAIATLIEHLFGLAVVAERPARISGSRRELDAFARALRR